MLITQEMVQAAFDWLHDNADVAAAAKAERIRAEHNTKRVKAKQFLASEGTVAERENKALASNEYDAAVERECRAVEADETNRNQRNKAEAIIEAWRTEQSNIRAMGKVA